MNTNSNMFLGIDNFIKDEVPTRDQKNMNNDLRREVGDLSGAGKQPTPTGRAQPRLAYGASSGGNALGRQGSAAKAHKDDRLHSIERENLKLKSKSSLLELEIKKMVTKLNRIDELMRQAKDNNYADSSYGSQQKNLQEYFKEYQDENRELNEKVKELRAVINHSETSKPLKKAPAKRAGSAVKQHNKPSNLSQSHLHASQTHGGSSFLHQSISQNPNYTPQQLHVLQELSHQAQKNQKQILQLQQEREKLFHASQAHGHHGGGQYLTQDDVLRKIRERESEIRELNNKLEEANLDYMKREKIFVTTKTYMEQMYKEIYEKKSENSKLEQENMSLNLKISQYNSLQKQLKDLVQEKELAESAITRMSAQPFLNREKGSSNLQRITELEQKLIAKDKQYKANKEEEQKVTKQIESEKDKLQRLKGERDFVERQSKQIKEKFTSNVSKFEEFNAYKNFFKADPGKYGQTMTDMFQKKEAYPAWADIDFLERGKLRTAQPGSAAGAVENEIQQLQAEIKALKAENKDFSAELEKAQNLLTLQKDIERDNHVYYENERKRLEVQANATSLKLQELCHRTDEKQRQINEIEKKIYGHQDPSSSAVKPREDQPVHSHLDDLETQSEFSIVSYDGDVSQEQNFLDIIVKDAEYYFESFKQVLGDRESQLYQKSLVTFVTIDFYNHNTETSQLSEGFRPLYNTQVSFMNKVDDFYVQSLQKDYLKIDAYISKNNSVIHLGHCRVLLRELIERERPMQDVSQKTPVIEKTVRILGKNDVHVGNVKIKMRMRKPLSQAVRYFREKNEIDNIKALDVGAGVSGVVTGGSRKKNITIQIVGCKDLQVKYGDVVNIAPFFYYQFYDFDERYSTTQSGKNPSFDDTQPYEVTLDSKMVHYLQNQPLEIILFDDNAPVTGVDRGSQAQGEQTDDMIGVAYIPLMGLIQGNQINDKFPIRKMNNQGQTVGTIEVKISIINIDVPQPGSTIKQAVSQASNMHYNNVWEQDLIMRIARKLATIGGEVETLFGAFSRGQKTVTKEDFKHTVLNRLVLKKEITEREIDMFLTANPRLQHKEIVTLDDFLMLFTASITQARHDSLDQEALNNATIKRFQQMQRQSNNDFERSFGDKDDGPINKMTSNDINMLDLLASIGAQGGSRSVIQKLRDIQQSRPAISAELFQQVLIQEGRIGNYDAQKVASYFTKNNQGTLDLSLFEEFMEKSLEIQAQNSLNLRNFTNVFKTSQGESLARYLINQDIDRDGILSLDGFKAALLVPDFGFNVAQAEEIFRYLGGPSGQFHFPGFIQRQNPNLQHLFAHLQSQTNKNQLLHSQSFNNQKTHNDSFQQPATSGRNLGGLQNPNTDTSILRTDSNITTLAGVNNSYLNIQSVQNDTPSLRIIKNKLKQYINEQNITLQTFFNLMDTNSDGQITLAEFKQKIKMLTSILDDGEINTLFQAIDRQSAGSINYNLFSQQFPEITISYLQNKIRNIIMASQMQLEAVFNEFCTDKIHKRMNSNDLRRLVKRYVPGAMDHEINTFFIHFSGMSAGGISDYVSLQDFIDGFGKDVHEQTAQLHCSIEDIIKPLATKINRFNVNVPQLFDKYDKNKNQRLSPEELAEALERDMHIQLSKEDIAAIRNYFKNRHNSNQIDLMNFMDLIHHKFTRGAFNDQDAKRALQLIKQKTHMTAMQICKEQDTENLKKVTLRGFKISLHNLKLLNQFEIDNLTKYMDEQDDGFISIDKFEIELKNTYVPQQSSNNLNNSSSGNLGLRATAGKHKPKW